MPKSNQHAGQEKDPVRKSPDQAVIWADELRRVVKSRSFYYALVIVVITFISFFPALKGGFLQTWDDEKYVTSNTMIKELSLENIGHMFSKQVNGTYIPLPLLSYSIEYKLFGDNPLPFHTTNLFLHILSTLLVFWILRLLKLDIIYAAFGALLFGIHPMRVESVAWITERKDVMYGFFYLASMVAYIIYVNNKPQNSKLLLLSVLLFLCSLLSKIEAVTLPLTLLLVDFLLLRTDYIKLIREKIPFFILSLLFGLLGVYIIYRVGLKVPDFLKSDHAFSFSEKFLFGLYSLTGYVIKFFVPYSQCGIYSYPVMTGWTGVWISFLNPVLIGLLIILVWWSLRKTRAIAFGALFFLFSVFFLLQIVAVGNGFFADRYTYIAYFGLIFITVWIAAYFGIKNSIWKISGIIVLSIFVLTCSALTFSRSRIWQDDVSLWTDVINQNPGRSMEPYANRGVAYTVKHEWDNALADFTTALLIDPKSEGVFSDRGIVYAFTGEPLKAIADFSVSIGMNPKNAKALFNRGVAYGNTNQADKAIADFRKVLDLDTMNVSAYAGLCMMLVEQKKFDSCRILVGKGLKLDPYRSELYAILGNCELETGDPDKAIAEFRHCLRIDNTSLDAYLGLVAAFVNKDDNANAMTNLRLAQEVAQQQGVRLDGMEDIIKSGVTLLDNKRMAIQTLFPH
ncbi:MAG: hypothetical protein WCK09_09365 [Bacteroidota bacterium]